MLSYNCLFRPYLLVSLFIQSILIACLDFLVCMFIFCVCKVLLFNFFLSVVITYPLPFFLIVFLLMIEYLLVKFVSFLVKSVSMLKFEIFKNHCLVINMFISRKVCFVFLLSKLSLIWIICLFSFVILLIQTG